MKRDLSLKTYYPYLNRKIYEYWYKLANGHYQINHHASLIDCIQMYIFCKKHSIPYKAKAKGENNTIGTILALTLLVLNRVNSDKNDEIDISPIEAI